MTFHCGGGDPPRGMFVVFPGPKNQMKNFKSLVVWRVQGDHNLRAGDDRWLPLCFVCVFMGKRTKIPREFQLLRFFLKVLNVRLKKNPVTYLRSPKNKGFNPGIAGFKCPKPITFKGVAAIETLPGMVKAETSETLKRNHQKHPFVLKVW